MTLGTFDCRKSFFNSPQVHNFKQDFGKRLMLHLETEVHDELRDLVIDAMIPARQVRPFVLYMVHAALTKRSDRFDEVAAEAISIEVAHRASLILDDMIDHDESRREIPTYYKRHDTSAALLVAHYMMALSSRLIAEAEPPVLRMRFFDAYRRMVLGQAIDCGVARSELRSWRECYEVAVMKTSEIFALIFLTAACKAGTCGAEEIAALEEVGRAIGRFYQVQNDSYDSLEAASEERGSATLCVTLSLPVAHLLDLKGEQGFAYRIGEVVERDRFQFDLRSQMNGAVSDSLAAQLAAERLAVLDKVEGIGNADLRTYCERFVDAVEADGYWNQKNLRSAGYAGDFSRPAA